MSFTTVTLQREPGQLSAGDHPLSIQGRMSATMRFLVWGTMPVGSLIGGPARVGPAVRATILAGDWSRPTAFLWVLFSSVRSLREIPTDATEGAS